MGRTCTVCRHPDRKSIDKSLLRVAYRTVAAQFGLSPSSVHRHGKEHLPLRLLAAAGEDERVSAAAVLADLQGLKVVANTILKRALQMGDLVVALRAVAELRGLLAVSLRGVETAELETRLSAVETALQQRRLTA